MIAVDTNILARFYCDDPEDPEAAKQRLIAKRVITESAALFIPKTVILELEWVMRGFYGLQPSDVAQALNHLLGLPQVTIENWEAVKDAVDQHRNGLDFADALHWASSKHCKQLLSFDDRKFARRGQKIKLQPEVCVPAA